MEESYKKVSFQEAKHIIDTEPNCVILDVRDEDEYITGHAENAVLFPVDTIDEDVWLGILSSDFYRKVKNG